VPQSYIYGSLGSPYLGAAATQNPASATAGLTMQIPAATQLSHAAALAAATSQFYEYQVSSFFFLLFFLLHFFRMGFSWIFFFFSFFDIDFDIVTIISKYIHTHNIQVRPTHLID
jgi:hypothetical protein